MSLGSAIGLAAERIVAPIEGMHRAIAGGWFAALDPLSRPIRMTHDAVARVVYGSIRLGVTAVGVGVDAGVVVESRTADSAASTISTCCTIPT